MEGSRDGLFMEEYKTWQRTNIENIVAMLRPMQSLHGENVIKLASVAYLSLIRQRWKRIGDESGNRSMSELFSRLWETSKSLFSYEVVQKDENSLLLVVSSCFWADEFRRLGAPEIGYELCCMADFYITEGFNPSIIYSRDKTIMRGDSYCDHHYVMARKQ
jgi:hypothetical protein